MAAAQTQNRYNARAGAFNSSIAQSQMAFRQQASRFVGAGALQGAGGRPLTGGSGFNVSSQTPARQMGQQIDRSMTAQQQQQAQNGPTQVNHNVQVQVSGTIAVGGFNGPRLAQALMADMEGMMIQLIKQYVNTNKGFQAGT